METETSDGVLGYSGLWALASTEMANQPFVKTVMGSRLRGIRESDKGIHGIAQPPQHRRRAAAHETGKEYVAVRSEARRSCGSGGPCPAFETTPAHASVLPEILGDPADRGVGARPSLAA